MNACDHFCGVLVGIGPPNPRYELGSGSFDRVAIGPNDIERLVQRFVEQLFPEWLPRSTREKVLGYKIGFGRPVSLGG